MSCFTWTFLVMKFMLLWDAVRAVQGLGCADSVLRAETTHSADRFGGPQMQ